MSERSGLVRAALVPPGGEASQSSCHPLVQFFSEIDCPKRIRGGYPRASCRLYSCHQFHDKIEREGGQSSEPDAVGRTRALAERSGDGRAMSGSTEWLGTTGGCENRRGGAPTACLRGRLARALGERSGHSDSAISRGGGASEPTAAGHPWPARVRRWQRVIVGTS
jgi:hypothetical protein